MKEITIEQAISCLQRHFGNGILDADTMLNIDMAKKIEQVRKIHPFAITPPKKSGGRWQTYYKNSSGVRKCIKAGTEQDLLEKLVDIYFSKSHLDKITFDDLFSEWLEYKKLITNSPNTIIRHKQHYN